MILTLLQESVKIRELVEHGDVRNTLCIGNSIVEFGLELDHDVGATAELPEQVRKKSRGGIDAS